METEQQQEHAAAAAVQNSLAAPASLSALERMPAEIILMIGSELCTYEVYSPSDFMIATLVSKRLRSVLLPQRFKKLKFSGSLKKLAYDMSSFLYGDLKHLMMTILSTLKSVTIWFEPYRPAEESTDSHLSRHRVAVISEFISKLSSIDLISLINGIDDIDFSEALVNKPKWNGPKAVIFRGCHNFPTFSTLINQFAPNTVDAVQFSSQTVTKHTLSLKFAFPLLKGLKTDVSSFKSRPRTFACMSSSNLQLIDQYFPHLEALILYQDNSRTKFHEKPHLPDLNEYVERLITQLKSMPRLRRFAFQLHRWLLCSEYDCESFDWPDSSSSGDESDDAMQTIPELNGWPYWLSTEARQERWSELTTRILKAVPQFKELCVMHSCCEFHRGTKIESILTVRQEEILSLAEPFKFPYALVDID
ncbi:hypothetical protein FAGAP_8021 [Fusarium agapanthi]|uniref:Uncharacterized protein n=1 Tax=Fusarium agapanthi TaxID=1803897 RepID=A0A9P5B6M8_9HYPO|nr:hypothetical protein FAGAP_8021 [Fusarium agapanthi]